MSMKSALIIACGLLAAAPVAANIQKAPDDPIIVTGSPAEARKQARSYVRALGVANGQQQAARWITGVCPRALGIEQDQARWVEDRVRTVGRAVRAPLAAKACDANLLVIFTKDADALVKRLGSRPPGRLGEPGSPAVRKLKTEQAPVRWWYNVGWGTSFGVPSSQDTPPGAKFADYFGNEAPPPGNDRTAVLHNYSASLLSTRAVRGIYAATMVVDVTRTKGASLQSLADYAALVGLAEINFRAEPDNSILSLFKPQGDQYLSDRDVSFLSGLYRITLDREASLHRQMLVNAIMRSGQAKAGE
jgi:hypothetical protein